MRITIGKLVAVLLALHAGSAEAQRVRPVPPEEERLIATGDSLINVGGEENLRRALAAFVRGEASARARRDDVMLGQFIMRQGGARLKAGDSAQALERFTAGASTFERIQHSNLTYALRSIGRLYWRAGQLDSASAYYGRARTFEAGRREPDRVMLQRLTAERDSIDAQRAARAPRTERRPRF